MNADPGVHDGPIRLFTMRRTACSRSTEIRRNCLDHVIVLDEMHLQRVLTKYFAYYNETRCHLSLTGDAPEPQSVQEPELGEVVKFPTVERLHDRYGRTAA